MYKSKKFISVLFVFVIWIGIFAYVDVDAKENTSAIPKISAKIVKTKTGTGIKVTINKTKDADGYVVKFLFICENIDLYNGYRIEGHLNTGSYMSFTTKNVVPVTEEIKLNGSKKRSMTLADILPGKYVINISAQAYKYLLNSDEKVYSDFSKEKTLEVTINMGKGGYKKKYDFSKVKVGDVIKFGAYEQDCNLNNGTEPIEWIVLSKNKSQIFVISRYILDRLPYNSVSGQKVTWETCTLREWLNTKFYDMAFNKQEKAFIKESVVENYDDAIYWTSGGNDTKDKIFILSELDMKNKEYGFSNRYEEKDINRIAAATIYAYGGPSHVPNPNPFGEGMTKDGKSGAAWRLRSPGLSYFDKDYVSGYGDVIYYGEGVGNLGIRPAMVIKLKSK